MGVCLVARYHFDYCGTLKAHIFVQDNLCCCGRIWGCVYQFDYCGTLQAQIFVQDNLCC